MIDHVLPIIVFLILWPILFFTALVYHNNFSILKQVMRLDFKKISKVEFWMSVFFSFLLSAIISYSLT